MAVIIEVVGSILAVGLETFNTWGNEHWASFSSQNYFDPNGLFIAVFVGLPLMVVSLITLGLRSTALRMRVAQKKEKKKSE
ncbi:conserved hypothetical protein [Perkinsus marinus ATCC 50983]|uniref:Uncharacterized protein n=1 Tax=Perkinsus marinus (strain ATCC 50983 / TXsc) TaxID=423536 RepID=C5LWC0_PERM5|nr:conserved hypothetical protein [Perkinsus marinus ATCC 50983]EEQ98962.1 conserved hypothetical protein [Perkinsus marinus ATCC 50983]|eukprot:XP_002766245.1 conserved hypothetical protein [Perkinsus marinus ATCC 50983]